MALHNNFPRIAKNQRQQKLIPKEAPWKTLVLNKQFHQGLRIQYHYVWNGARAWLRWNKFLLARTFASKCSLHILYLFTSLFQGLSFLFIFFLLIQSFLFINTKSTVSQYLIVQIPVGYFPILNHLHFHKDVFLPVHL